jgi:hypothetical protein
MLPKDVGSALVRIGGEKGGEAAGAGFICYQSENDILILTSSKVIQFAAGLTSVVPPGSKVWINGDFEAATLLEISPIAETDFAVLRSTAAELRRCHPLPLGTRPMVGDARIVSYQAIRTNRGTQNNQPFPYTYEPKSEDDSELILRNDRLFPILANHYGSPVIDDNSAIGVVTRVQPAPSNPGMEQEIAVAFMDNLPAWPGRPADLLVSPDRAAPKPTIFLSYAHEDREIVARVEQALVDNGLAVWRDQNGLVAGSSFVQGIGDALDSVEAIAVFFSPHSDLSRAVQAEMDAAVARSWERESPAVVVPVLLVGAHEPTGVLRGQHAVDLRDGDIARAVAELIRAIGRRKNGK